MKSAVTKSSGKNWRQPSRSELASNGHKSSINVPGWLPRVPCREFWAFTPSQINYSFHIWHLGESLGAFPNIDRMSCSMRCSLLRLQISTCFSALRASRKRSWNAIKTWSSVSIEAIMVAGSATPDSFRQACSSKVSSVISFRDLGHEPRQSDWISIAKTGLCGLSYFLSAFARIPGWPQGLNQT